jgi:hypothetical protein
MAAIEDEFLSHDLHDNDFLGVVTNNLDSTYSGRCQVKVFGVLEQIKLEHLPWASPVNSTIFAGNGAGSLSVPKVGQFVRVLFNNGDLYAPEYTTIQNIDSQLIEKIKSDYLGTHVLLFDPEQDLNVIFQKGSGLLLFYKESFIQISPDNMITLQHANAESIIQLEGDVCRISTKNEVQISAAAKATITADESILNGKQTTKIGPPGNYYHALLAEPLIGVLLSMAAAIDAKLPLTPGVNVALVEEAKSAMISTNVLISK